MQLNMLEIDVNGYVRVVCVVAVVSVGELSMVGYVRIKSKPGYKIDI